MIQRLLLVLMVFAGFSCKQEVANPDLGLDYFPIKVGNTYLYQLDSIAFDDNTKSTDTFSFTLHQLVDTVFTNQHGDKVYVLNQKVSLNDTLNWQPRENLFIQLTNNQLIETSNNTPVVKLVFPIGNVNSWNGNMLNSNFRQTFNLLYHNQKQDDFVTCKVQEIKNINAIEDEQRFTVYAKQVGVISSLNQYLNTQVQGTSGYKVTKTLISYNNQ